MTEIALRTYNQEVKDLIDHGHFDEAIAHCQHILETFPRHIETYRLLGKAFLEQGRHGDAADVFQRVLSAVPEDWLSHVAMAIVREDESNLDMAIWHMERAYEVNPSNPTVQAEVRRLRGRRDGVEPPKLRLTRSALARMYIKGGLFGQAIAEIRGALAEDPDRPDLQVLLASALFDSGAIQEAADICSSVLGKLPYCLDANRVLGQALLASDKKDDAEKLFQRIESLDPYIDLDILKKDKRLAEHPAQSITLSRLEYEGQEKTVRTGKQPSWASSLGLKIEEPQKGQALPDWLSAASQPSGGFAAPAQPAAPAAPASDVPSWLNAAASAMSSPAVNPAFGAPVESSLPAEPSIARTATGELPDWIQSQSAPAEPPPMERPSSPLPGWLSAPSAPPPAEPPPARTTSNTLPEWIKTASLPPEKPAEKISDIPDWLNAPAPPSVEALPSTSLPDWSRPETKTGPLEVEPGNIPDWLSSSQPATPDIGPEPEWLKQSTSPKPAEESVPDWMKGVAPVEPAGAAAGSVPDWLKESTANTAKPVELVPEWMRGDSAESHIPAAAQTAPPPAPTDDVPEWMKPEPSEAPPAPSSAPLFGAKPDARPQSAPLPAKPPPAEMPLPDWMNPEPAAPVAAPAASAPAEPEALPEATVPDWLKEAAGPVPVALAPSAPLPAEAPEASLPDWLNPPSAGSSQAAEAEPVANLPDWLNTPVPSAPAAIAEPAAPSAPGSAMPDWMSGTMPPMPQEPPAQPVSHLTPAEAEPEPAPSSGIELPDWLKAVPPPAPVPAPAPMEPAAEPVPATELPDWLRSATAEEIAPPPPPAQIPPEKIQVPAPPMPLPHSEPEPAAPPPAAIGFQNEEPPASSVPGPAHVTPTSSEGIDLPEWLVSQLQGKPKEPAGAPATIDANTPLPDWLKPATPGTQPAPVLDWEKAASQPVPAAPVDATRPATGLSSTPEKPAGGPPGMPGWLDKSKPTGSDTVARWLDRRLKTSTLSSLDESALKGGTKPPASPSERSGTGTQLPTWLDTQKPGGSDTVVRWMDKRETGSLRKTPTATFSSISKAAAAAAAPAGSEPKPPESTPASTLGTEDTVASRHSAQPAAPTPLPAVAPSTPALPVREQPTVMPKPATAPYPPRIETAPPPKPATAPYPPRIETAPPPKPATAPYPPRIETAPPPKPAAPAAIVQPGEEEEEGAFVPPPEWLQKALGSAVADVPPIPKKQTGGLTPGTVTPVASAVPVPPVPPPPVERRPVPGLRLPPVVEEPEPEPAAKPGEWVPLADAPVAATVGKTEKPARKPARKKARKLTEVETEALLREARVYLETDLQKASEAYQRVIENPESAETVAGDLTTYLEQDPASPQLWNLLGDACSRAGRLQDAYKAYAEALRRM
jgi:tetratricopeptide (TPR) repeat protein